MKDSHLSELTLVMPTYGRSQYTLRNMRYWSGRGVTMHVLDGSQIALNKQQLALMDINIYYHHLPVSIIDRLKKAAGLISTPYVALIGDDEFFIPNALVSCIEELELDSELVSCMGRCIRFDYLDLDVVGCIDYHLMENYSILQDDPNERMAAHMDVYTPSTIYSVVRSDVWMRAMSTVVQKEFPAYAIGELQFELAVCYQGKSKVIPELMWLRSTENMPTRGTDISLVVSNTFEKWWHDPEKLSDRMEFLQIMSETLARTPDEIQRASHGVRLAVDMYVKSSMNRLDVSTFGRLKNFMVSRIPVGLKTFLKEFLRGAFKFNDSRQLFLTARDLESTGVRVDFEELKVIKALVLNFHAEKCG